MNVAVVYIVVSHGRISDDYCARFVASYHECPPGFPHETIVCCNGGPLNTESKLLFVGMGAGLFPRVNDQGFDLSGYQDVAAGPAKDVDALLCLGESVYFHRAGWLARLVEAWDKHGPGLYGPFASHNVRAHLNTTAFMCSPKHLLTYPERHWTRAARYEAEHGLGSFWRRTQQRGLPVRFVTWDGEWPPGQWRQPPNILWRGTQENLLMLCNHSDRWANADAMTKIRWAAKADQPFR